MSGFFGMFNNYDKAGPGIEKNAPKKKTFIVFFETFFRNFWNFVPINFLYWILTMPLLPLGLGAVGITHVTRNISRDKHSFGVSDFVDTIKRNWKQALGAGIINIIVTFLILFALWFYSNSINGYMYAIGVGLSMCMIFIFTNMNFYIWTMIITFNLKLKQIYRNSFRFVFINLKNNLICDIVIIAVIALYVLILYLVPYTLTLAIEILVAFCTLPAFVFLLIQFATFPSIKKYMIDPYYAARPDEDIEKRKNLGVYEEPTEEPEEEQNIQEETLED